MKQAYYSCEEHIETVLDMYIDDHELPPEIRKSNILTVYPQPVNYVETPQYI